MDIQLNIGHRSMSYLCKYVTKLDTHSEFSINSPDLSARQKHLRARSMGAVEAVYDILGLHKQSADTDVLFIDTNMPGARSVTLSRRRNGEMRLNIHKIGNNNLCMFFIYVLI